jgi:hypothetical protein
MLGLGLSLNIESETIKVSVSVSTLRLRKVKSRSRSRQRDWQSAYTGLGLETPTLVSLIPGCSNPLPIYFYFSKDPSHIFPSNTSWGLADCSAFKHFIWKMDEKYFCDFVPISHTLPSTWHCLYFAKYGFNSIKNNYIHFCPRSHI